MGGQRIGFIGLGIMGKPMAINLQRAGYPLVVHDVAAAPVAQLVGRARRRATPPATSRPAATSSS